MICVSILIYKIIYGKVLLEELDLIVKDREILFYYYYYYGIKSMIYMFIGLIDR